MILDKINKPDDLKKLSLKQFLEYCYKNRNKILSLSNIKLIKDIEEDEIV